MKNHMWIHGMDVVVIIYVFTVQYMSHVAIVIDTCSGVCRCPISQYGVPRVCVWAQYGEW